MSHLMTRRQTGPAHARAADRASARPSGTAIATSPGPYRYRWLMLPVVLTVMFMAGFDIWAVNVAAPSLQQDLRVSDAALQLIVGGYAFMYASGMVTGGRLGDLFGYRRLFLIGVAAFITASLLCGLAQNPAELIGFRLVQGLTGALMVPQVLALITAIFPVAERARALAWFGVVMGLGFVTGQILGGGLLSADPFGLKWRSVFLVNVPVGLVALALAARLVPSAFGQRRPKLDPLGAAGVSAGLALALVPLTLGRNEGWPVWTWISMAAALPVLAGTVWYERWLADRGGQPLLDLALFRDRAFSVGLLVNVGITFTFGSFMFVLTLLLQEGMGLSPFAAGVRVLPLAATFTAMSMLGRRVASRLGGWAITAGTVATTAGMAGMVLTGLGYGSGLTGWQLAAATAMIGLGNGTIIPLLIGAVLEHVRPERAGAASGVLSTMQQFGVAAGIAVIGAVFYAALGAHPDRGAFVTAMEVTLAVNAVVLALVAGSTLLLPGRRSRG